MMRVRASWLSSGGEWGQSRDGNAIAIGDEAATISPRAPGRRRRPGVHNEDAVSAYAPLARIGEAWGTHDAISIAIGNRIRWTRTTRSRLPTQRRLDR